MSLELVANTALLNVTTTSASVSVPLPASLPVWSHDVSIVNVGTATAYVTVGKTAAIPASGTPAAGFPVPAGSTAVLHAPTTGISSVAAIAGAATTLCISACIVAV
ncbi:MAG: hypothetical protein ACREPF_04590 [Rhodanobacteraceae bacterium]